jgi:hypothetical protein
MSDDNDAITAYGLLRQSRRRDRERDAHDAET